MRITIWMKGIIVGIIMILIESSIMANVAGYMSNMSNESDWEQLSVTIPYSSTQPHTQSFGLIKFFMTFINGTGETSTTLEEMNDDFKLLLVFDFINAEAELRLGRFGLPLWEWFPSLFNRIGPQRYQVVGFLGDIQKINENIYHIEGYCARISGRTLT